MLGLRTLGGELAQMRYMSDSSNEPSESRAFRGTERFRVVRRLGMGGMGVVYEAVDRERDTRVAIKTLQWMSPETVLSLKNEFRALQDIHHPNLIHLGELVEAHGQWFFSMELVDGVDFLTFARPADVAHAPEARTCSPSVMRLLQASQSPELEPVQTPGGFDERKLRDGLRQLASAIRALHAAGKLHRDIKPSNVLVATEGRVVLLDFGLVIRTNDQRLEPAGHSGGTPGYMAPEQSQGHPIGPEADWYSVGVMVFRCLTGRMPFVGSHPDMLAKKLAGAAPPPSEVAIGVPTDLDRLCGELLRPDPAQRPGGAEILRRLGASEASGRVITHSPCPGLFVGRAVELEALEGAFGATEAGAAAGAAATWLVRGEAGIGKSALVQQFVDGLAGRALVLAGRCHERESVPYKGFDGVIDALSHHLVRLPRAAATALLPPHFGLLCRVFPVLGRLDGLAADLQAPADPQELRGQVFEALRGLLMALGRTQPVVLTIDDLQWADADSVVLLNELLRTPAPTRTLVVATVRSAPEEGPLPGALAGLRHPAHRIDLTALPPPEATTLARRLLAQTDSPHAGRADEIAAEAQGHPRFIDELVQAIAVGACGLRLEQALHARMQTLAPAPRLLLEFIALGAPLAERAATVAAGIDRTELDRQLAQLRSCHLVRSAAEGGVEPYHDRIRDAAVMDLSSAERRARHRALAGALEATGGASAETLCEQWRSAGDGGRAARHAVCAAEEASRALAFDRAARLYRVGLELGLSAGLDGQQLKVRMADALAAAGHAAEAAETYQVALRGAAPGQALELERRAAEQLLRGGHIDAGLDVLARALGRVGIRRPTSPRRARLSLLAQRAQLSRRGLRFRDRPVDTIGRGLLARIDLSWVAAAALTMVDPLRGAEFQARHLAGALEAGEPGRVARALALEACYLASVGAVTPARRMLGVAERLARTTGHAHAEGLTVMAHALEAYQRGRFQDCLTCCERAEALLRARCTGVAWELGTLQMLSLWSIYYLGRLRELARRVPELFERALVHGDLYMATNLRTGVASLAALVQGDVKGARLAASEAAQQWSQQGFHLQHYWQLYAQLQIDLYTGDGEGAEQRFAQAWPTLRRSLLLQTPSIHLEVLDLRARIALTRLTAGATARHRLRAVVARATARIARSPLPWASPLASLLRAGAAAAAGKTSRVRPLLTRAVRGFEAAGMALHASVARRRAGEQRKDAQGHVLLVAADAMMVSEGVSAPERLVALLAPGFPR